MKEQLQPYLLDANLGHHADHILQLVRPAVRLVKNADMMWGDVGRLYLWMTEDALRNRQFDKSWMILQCS
jgi:uncharacterized protein YwqG